MSKIKKVNEKSHRWVAFGSSFQLDCIRPTTICNFNVVTPKTVTNSWPNQHTAKYVNWKTRLRYNLLDGLGNHFDLLHQLSYSQLRRRQLRTAVNHQTRDRRSILFLPDTRQFILETIKHIDRGSRAPGTIYNVYQQGGQFVPLANKSLKYCLIKNFIFGFNLFVFSQ